MSTTIDYSDLGNVFLNQTNASSSIQYSTDNVTWTDVVWPLYIQNSNFVTSTLNVKIQSNLNITNVNNIFIINGHNITIDGNNYNVTVTNVTNFPGLIQNGTGGTNGYNNVTIQKINIGMSGSSFIAGLGWICQSNFGNGTSNNTIQNCTSSAPIPNNGGGIVGSWAGANSTSFTVQNCSASGDIWDVQWGSEAGGIIGAQAGSNATLFTVQNCSFSGGIYGNQSGGIVGGRAHKITITNCSTSGSVKGGGIIGASAGQNYGRGDGMVTISDCFSTGNMGSNGGSWGGGIVAEFAGNMSITRCYSTGQIGGNGNRYCGGIVGNKAGDNRCSVTVSNCFSTGDINDDCGGIATRDFGMNSDKCIITNCYSIGNLVGTRSGGIVASNPGRNCLNGVDIINCFTLGSIGGEGGIIGWTSGSGFAIVKVTNCYVYSTITNNNAVIAPNSSLIPVVTNFYSANNNWSDTVADTFLTGINTIWRSVYPNTPYQLIGVSLPQIQQLAPVINSVTSTTDKFVIDFSQPLNSIRANITHYSWSIDGINYYVLNQTASPLPVNFTELPSGLTSHTFRIKCYNGRYSNISNLVVGTINNPPPEPIITSVEYVDGSVNVYFTQSTVPLSLPITNYAYSIDGTNYTLLNQTTSPLQIRGLNVSQNYSIRIQAFNAKYSKESTLISILTDGKHVRPTITNIAQDNQSTAMVYFTQPANIYNSAITNYAYSIDGINYTLLNQITSPFLITGLQSNQIYTVSIKNYSSMGYSEPSISANVEINPPQPAPIITNISFKEGSPLVYFTQNTNDGSPITGYSYSIDNGVTYTDIDIITSPFKMSGFKPGIKNNITLRNKNIFDSRPSETYNFTYYVKVAKTPQ